MKIETSELIGPQLDWAAAKAADIPIVIGWCQQKKVPLLDKGKSLSLFCPSTDPDQANEILKCLNIRIYPDDPVSPKVVIIPNANEPHYWYRQYGETVLIASIRCFVASVLGSEIEVPDELFSLQSL